MLKTTARNACCPTLLRVLRACVILTPTSTVLVGNSMDVVGSVRRVVERRSVVRRRQGLQSFFRAISLCPNEEDFVSLINLNIYALDRTSSEGNIKID
ncbi:hypothetical protein BDN72DRAFT_429279 [Pluteus cervinus]|uniref:Uncharacterized protein n=1 Tax=Pluteus cervinus TaxID=181527 RepID=A0ACD3A7T0_9AGAR|nr:hypothetical protein BDN72DRAFT_429279 [Pluteus cervinus]